MKSATDIASTLEPVWKTAFGSPPESSGVVVCPEASEDIPDGTPLFRVAYMRPELCEWNDSEIRARLAILHRFWGQTRRQFRNAVAFVLPERSAIHETLGVIRESPPLENSDPGASSAQDQRIPELLLSSYRRIYLPHPAEGYMGTGEFDLLEIAPSLVHDVEELCARTLNRLRPFLQEEIPPRELARLLGLGEVDCAGIRRLLFPMTDVARWFFAFLGMPRFQTVEPIRESIMRGVEEGDFGWIYERALLPLDGLPTGLKKEVSFRTRLEPGRIAFEPGAYLVSREALKD